MVFDKTMVISNRAPFSARRTIDGTFQFEKLVA
jgi:hypothetical protein